MCRLSHFALCLQPTGLLAYLDSSDSVPEKDVDRMHIRDNLKLATVSNTHRSSFALRKKTVNI